MAHASFDPVNEPALSVHRHDWDMLSCDVPAVFQHRIAAQNVLAHALALDLLLTHFTRAGGLQFQKQGVFVGL